MAERRKPITQTRKSQLRHPPRDLAPQNSIPHVDPSDRQRHGFFCAERFRCERVQIDGLSIRTRDTVRFEDLQGNVLCEIRPRLPSVRDAIHVTDLAGERLATVSRRMITPIRDQFTIQIIEGDILDVVGIAAAHEFDITGPDGLVAIISRIWFRSGIRIVEILRRDPAIVLAAVVGVDILVGDKR